MENREIKFRAWVDDFHKDAPDKTPAMMDWKYLKTWTFSDILSSGSKIMQFTGRQDADINGKDVYEGDIIETVETKLLQIVYWNEEKCAWFCKYVDNVREVSLCHSLGNLNKVIGNIYENPELLKQLES